ncbi:MAG TPA: helix-hairpin-helix domain-containing protein [Gemmatimonadales bacterium]
MPSEHRAILILLALAIGGHGARHVLSSSEAAPGAIRFLGDSANGSPRAHRDSVMAHARPLGRGERIDLDRASVRELERLPGVGPGLARKIAADRDARGPFGSLAGLDRVPGVGAGLLARIGPAATFSGTPRAASAAASAGPPAAAPPVGAGSRAAIDINTASEAVLQTLPGIGPAKARAIVAYREAHGPFASVQALGAVPGIGPVLVAKVAAALGVP